MKTPESPSRKAPPATGLDDKINELDGLITGKTSVPQEKTGATGIPVLDEIIEVDEQDFTDDVQALFNQEESLEDLAPGEHISNEQLDAIMGNVEEKLAGELDALVTILKDSIKDSIMTEVKTQLETTLRKPARGKPDDGSSS